MPSLHSWHNSWCQIRGLAILKKQQLKAVKGVSGWVSLLKYYEILQKQPSEMFYKKGVLENFAKFTGKRLCHSIFFNKVADLSPATLFQKRLWHRCFPVNFAKFLRTPFSQNISGWLLLIFAVFQNNCFWNFCECSSLLLLHN